ncbi:Leucine-rich repeat and guanylate kinase domain-containing protein [Vulpes lagopus]
MAAAGSDPQGPVPSSRQSSARAGGQSTLLRSEKERRSCRSSFPMGQRPEGTFHKASSYLLQQLIHRSRESDAGGEEYRDDCEGEAESEESSESEMLNLEVCLAPARCAAPPAARPAPPRRSPRAGRAAGGPLVGPRHPGALRSSYRASL